jgi:hypothetical protein
VTTPERRRILHVVGSMDRGGIETWLMHILRNANRQRLQMDFLVHLARPGRGCPRDEQGAAHSR